MSNIVKVLNAIFVVVFVGEYILTLLSNVMVQLSSVYTMRLVGTTSWHN